MPSSVIRDAALEMMKAIDRTNPDEYSTNDEYARDYRLRWSAAMELLRYAELANDFEDDYTDDEDDESVASNDMEEGETEDDTETDEDDTETDEDDTETDEDDETEGDEDYETEASSYCDEEFEEIDSVSGPRPLPRRNYNIIDDTDSDDESVYAQY